MFKRSTDATISYRPLGRLCAILKTTLMVSFPIIAAIAYSVQAHLVLLAVALFLPAIALLGNNSGRSAVSWRDPETGLGDQAHLVALIDEEIEKTPDHLKLGFIALSIDNFADIEREWGKMACDRAIADTATRMASILRSSDEIGRLSRTDFGVMISSLRSPETSAVINLCERLQGVTAAPIKIGGSTLHLTVSAGFCLADRAPQRTGSALVSASQAALADARQNAPKAIRGYSGKAVAKKQGDSASDVLSALRDGQIYPWFQPQISTDTGEITGFEALARWEHPERGILPPSAFLPALEAANKLEALGEAILNHALRALVDWDKAGVIVPSVAVNFATQELSNPSLVERIKWDVDRFEVDPSRLTVEILETVISQHDDDIITRNIRSLGAQGFRIDLDDFGTGHASLANIRRFAVDRIKIDRSFVANVDTDPEQQRMIAAIIGLGERLQIETLAEGVETISEQSILSQLGCNHLQGFAITRPMPFEQTIEWIKEHEKTLHTTPVIRKKAG